MKLDYYIGNNLDGEVTEASAVMGVKDLFHRFGYQVALHVMFRADDTDCFHTHPAWAIRRVIRGGYLEEVVDPWTGIRTIRAWRPGDWGIVHPALCHRIAGLLANRSMSLWIRGKCTEKIHLLGDGWDSRQPYEIP